MTEPDLGPLFRASGAPIGQLDADTIIAQSRRRRLPRVVIATALPIIAVIGLLGGGVYGLSQVGGFATSSAGSASKAVMPGTQAAPVPAPFTHENSTATGCSATLPSTLPTSDGLVATSSFPSPAAATAPAETTVTNTGVKLVSGTAGTPTIVVVRNGTVVARTTVNDSAGHSIHLSPGGSMKLRVYLPDEWCSRAAPRGSYEVYTQVELTLDNGKSEVITGPPSPLNFDK